MEKSGLKNLKSAEAKAADETKKQEEKRESWNLTKALAVSAKANVPLAREKRTVCMVATVPEGVNPGENFNIRIDGKARTFVCPQGMLGNQVKVYMDLDDKKHRGGKKRRRKRKTKRKRKSKKKKRKRKTKKKKRKSRKRRR